MNQNSRGLFGLKSLATLLLLAGPSSAEVIIPTSVGSGADAMITNDSDSGPTVTHGTADGMELRYWEAVRSRHMLVRFDLSSLGGSSDRSDAILTLYETAGNRARSVQIYGLRDESTDAWEEATVSYATMPGSTYVAETNVLGRFAYDVYNAASNPTGKWQLLGTLDVADVRGGTGYLRVSSPATLPLDEFLEADSNDLVSLLVVWGGDNAGQWYFGSKESAATEVHPRLTLPNAVAGDEDGDGLGDLWEDKHFGDNDGTATTEELALQSGTGDPDEDTFDNAAEFAGDSDPTNPASIPTDIDGDGLADLWEDLHFGDGNGIIESTDITPQNGTGDPDLDSGTNEEEETAGTSPNDRLSFIDLEDGTGDGLNDWWEIRYFGDTATATSPAEDNDSDTFSNEAEYAARSNPNDPLSVVSDIDADGVPDLWEDQYYGNFNAVIDDADLTGSDGTGDADADTFNDLAESNAVPVPSNPNNAASVPGNADGDSLDDAWELNYFTDIFGQNGLQDSDNDFYTNEEEETLGTDPADPYEFAVDDDDDGINDRWELAYFTDLDGTNDLDGDSDEDGYSDGEEYDFGSDPNNAISGPDDIDGDGLDDINFELIFFGDIYTYDGDDDPDRDFATNEEEEVAGTDPNVRTISPDSDFDGLGDAWEIFSFGSILVEEGGTDDPGVRDLETGVILSGDPDGDTYLNSEEYANATNGNDPVSTPDTDADGLPEGWELVHFILDGEDPVTDRATILARQSGATDFDNDGASNLLELISGTLPNDDASLPDPALITTAVGRGADTDLQNDDQGGPDLVRGADAGVTTRDNRASRMHVPLFRFDLEGLSGDLTNAALQLDMTFGSRGGIRAVEVFGLVDGDPGEFWDEATTTYANSPGLLLDQLDARNVWARDPKKWRYLGTMGVPQTGTALSNPVSLDLASFIAEDTNGVMTLALRASSQDWHGIRAKEDTAVLAPPSLVLPMAEFAEPVGGLRIESVSLDAVGDTFTMNVTGLVSGQDYHVQSLKDPETAFSPVVGSTFTAAGAVQAVSVPTDNAVDPVRLFRVSDGAEP